MEPQPQTQSIAGVFTPRLVARLHREGFEGTLRLHAGGATRVIYFRRGDIASAASNAEEDRLHNILIREGRLTGPQVEMARSRQRPGASLGKVLIELGFLTPSELLQGARRQVRQILAACFALTDGSWQTAAGPLGPEVTNLGLPARRLIFDALMEAGDRRVIVREMGSMESVYEPTAALANALSTLRLEPSMEEVARMIDGRATLRELSSRTRLDDFTVSRIVLALDILGLAGLATRPESAVAARPESAVVARPGRVIPVESGDDSAAEVAVRPVGPPVAAAPAPIAAPAIVAPSAAGQRWESGSPASPGGAPVAMTPAGEENDTNRLPTHLIPITRRPVEEGAMPPAFAGSAYPSMPPTPAGPATEPPVPTPATATEDTAVGGTATYPAEWDRAPAVAPAPPPEAEPPPFPRHELPAFADGTQEALPVWTVDPETGEKVHEGPIELTFDGPVAPRTSGRPPARFILAAGLVVFVIAALALSLYIRSGDRGADATPDDNAAGSPAATIPAEDAPATDGTGSAGAAEGQAGDEAAAVATPPDDDPVAAAESEPPPPGDTAAPGVTGAPVVETTPPAPTVGTGDPRLAAGQALLDAGDIAGASAAFRTTLAALPADRITLQLLIACEEATVRKARAALAPDDPLFVTPFTMQGRSCHRLLWGIYPDLDAAQMGAALLPPYFTGAGVKPVAISIGRLRG